MAGTPLLRGVSFRLERRERLTLAGRNGAGKTTLLRMLAGESSIDGGELSLAKDVRIALHDQRPPRHPDLLLLDEPTNHLDIESLEWLEAHLQTLDAAVVLVAHDRWFLEAVGTAVLELEGGRGRFFAGPWHAWRKEQAARELALGRAIERQEAEIARLERFVTRFRAGTRSRQAQSRQKRLDKMDRVG